MANYEEKIASFRQVLEVLDELREKCPWDMKQTNESLRVNTIEETFELCDAIMKDNSSEICKELGDLLLHIGFYARIAEEKSQFSIADVCDQLVAKLKFRHPHIYADVEVNGDSDKVIQNWEELKLKERGNKRVLQGVPESLPSLIKAHRIQDKARNVGFDWDQKEQVWDKVREEFEELMAEIDRMNADKAEQEFGDLFFSLVNAARLYGINPDNALEKTNQKFIRRFNYLEDQTLLKGHSLREMTLEQMDLFWEEAKSKGL